MSQHRTIALQLRKLASDPDSQTFLCQEAGCLKGLVALVLSDQDLEALVISLQALWFLSSHPSNRVVLNAQTAMMTRVQALGAHELESIRQLAQQILENLQRAPVSATGAPSNAVPAPTSSSSSSSSPSPSAPSSSRYPKLLVSSSSAAATPTTTTTTAISTDARRTAPNPLAAASYALNTGLVSLLSNPSDSSALTSGPSSASPSASTRPTSSSSSSSSAAPSSGASSSSSPSLASYPSASLLSTAAPSATRSRYLSSGTLQWNGGANTAEERTSIEKALVTVRGVVSASVNKQGLITIYSHAVNDDLMQRVTSAVTSLNPAWRVAVASAGGGDAEKENRSNEGASADAVTTSVASAASASAPGYLPSTSATHSRALAPQTGFEQNSMQHRYQQRKKQQEQVESKQTMVKGLFSSVTSYFW